MDSFQKFDCNNESRASFSRFSISRVIKLLTHFNPKFEEDSEEKLRDQEEKFLNIQQESVLKQIMKGKQSIFLNLVKKEDFVSYENWKKFQESNDLQIQNSGNYEIKYKEMSDLVFKYLSEDSFEFIHRKSDNLIDEKVKISSGLLNISPLNERKKSSETDQSPMLNDKWADLQNKLGFCLQNEEFRRFFAEFLVEQVKEKSYLSMNHDCFLKFINIIRDLIKCLFYFPLFILFIDMVFYR